MTRIKWKPSREGFTDSHDGKWSIEPLWCGRVKPVFFKLSNGEKIISRSCFTQREAKRLAQDTAEREGAL